MTSPLSPTDRPVFVRGLSRSGGTLLVTLLDAHPGLSMSYELYPNLLEGPDGKGPPLDELERVIRRSRSLAKSKRGIADDRVGIFVVRCARGGLEPDDLVALLGELRSADLDLSTDEGRFALFRGCCVAKQTKHGKALWGAKCNGRYPRYLRYWPRARFLNVIRDGRDVLASQLRTGSFRPVPEILGTSWSRTHARFRELDRDPEVETMEVRYERLTTEPEAELLRICDFLNLDFDPSMLDFHRQDLTIYGASHLSMDRISQPVDTSRVGRWRNELTPEQLEAFLSTAGPMMRELGYLDDDA